MEQDNRTRSQRWSDNIAIFCGSWGFVFWSLGIIAAWMLGNGTVAKFDTYPYTFLNLVLTVVSTMQSPIIMMSQNRQAERDKEAERVQAERDREMVRELKVELAIQHEMLQRLLSK